MAYTQTTPNLIPQNKYSSTLAQAMTSTDTIVYLNSLPTASEGFLTIDEGLSTEEVVHYTSKGANYVQLTGTNDRAVYGSAVGHAQGASVKMKIVAEYWKALQDGTAFRTGAIGASAYADGWTPLLGSLTPNTVTYNGNRSYSLVFNSTDLTGYISNGMRLRMTRTVTAPTQCTSLNGTTQYYSKSSPAGMTFADDFVVSAWIKLSSYAQGTIVSRYNGTSGWKMTVQSNGQLFLQGFNGGSGNNSYVISYQSVPLNKWVHVAAQLDMSVFTASTTTSYVMIDGVDVPASVTRGGTNPTALVQAGNLEIGGTNTGTEPFSGKIAQVAIYNAKVTQATVLASMHQTLSGSETSLISAYSFNNSINDLNTTNANNLTANGSAVATNADSPFAGGANASTAYTAGTTEFGEVFNVSFSTNTTVVVQVPDGYAIPTSGGVSALAYSTQATPLGWPGLGSVLGYALVANTFTTTNVSATQMSGMSVTVYVPAGGRRVKITVAGNFVNQATANTNTVTSIWDGTVGSGTQLAQQIANSTSSGAAVPVSLVTQTFASSGSKTYNVGLHNNGGSSSSFNASATAPAHLIVELV